MIDLHFLGVFIKYQAIVSAFPQAAATSAAALFRNMGLAVRVLLGLACTGAAAHTDIFDGASETSHLMALEMGEADEHIGIHDSTSDFGL